MPSKLELGKSIGLNVPCTAVAVEKAGSAQHNISDIVSKVTGVAPSAPSTEKREAKPAAAQKQKPAKAAAAAAAPKAETKTKEKK